MRRRAMALTGLTMLAALAGMVSCAPSNALPVWGSLPEFTLVDQDSQPFGSSELNGQVWISDFVFTRCPSRCPMLTRQMEKIQREIRANGWQDVRLVSISVDPENDTPETLTAYAEKHGADGGVWRFLTGSREAVWGLSVDGFKLAVADAADSGGGPILHSNKFVLADRCASFSQRSGSDLR